jgi:dCTP deaminase
VVLSDREILNLSGVIFPFNSDQLKPASYDMTLGTHFIRFPYDNPRQVVEIDRPRDDGVLEEVEPGDSLLLQPGEFILAQTAEKVCLPDNLVGRVEGKSTTGRSGLMVHVTAGYIDPGFRGYITLELCGLRNACIRLTPGTPIAQLSLLQMTSKASQPYRGRYQDAGGVQPARPEAPFKISITDEARDRSRVTRPTPGVALGARRCVEAPACPQDVNPPIAVPVEGLDYPAGGLPVIKGTTREPTSVSIYCNQCGTPVVHDWRAIALHVGHHVSIVERLTPGPSDLVEPIVQYGGEISSQHRPGEDGVRVMVGRREFGRFDSA